MSAAYDSGFSDGYAEGYACKLTDATEPFAPQSLDVPKAVEAVADMLASKYRAAFSDRPSAIGCARMMIAAARTMTRSTAPSIFDLLEPLADRLIDRGGPDIRTGFARATGGVDLPWLVDVLSERNSAQANADERNSASLVERVARALHEYEECWNDTAWEFVPSGTQTIFRGRAKAALEASGHAELVKALGKIANWGPGHLSANHDEWPNNIAKIALWDAGEQSCGCEAPEICSDCETPIGRLRRRVDAINGGHGFITISVTDARALLAKHTGEQS